MLHNTRVTFFGLLENMGHSVEVVLEHRFSVNVCSQ